MSTPPPPAVDGDLFMRVLTGHTVFLAQALLGPQASEGFLRKLGESIGRWVEDSYRATHQVAGPLTEEQYCDLVEEFKRQTGACVGMAPAEGARFCLRNTYCPFAEVIQGTDVLCQLDAHILGSIAGRNLGYAQLVAHSTLVTGGPECRLELHTRRCSDPDALLVFEYGPSPAEPPEAMRESLAQADTLEALRREVGASQAALNQANRSLEALLEASVAISSTLDEPELLRQVARSAAELSGGPAAFAARLVGDELAADGWWNGHEWFAEELRWPAGHGPMGRCISEGGSVVVEGGWGHGGPPTSSEAENEGTVWVCVPIAGPQGPLGVIGAQAAQRDSQMRVRLLEGLARQAAIAMLNAHLYAQQKQETETATHLLEELKKTHQELVETQDQLVDAEKLAAIGLFSQGIAHDLRSPLSAIRTALYTLQSRIDPSDPRAARAISLATQQVQRADRIIRDMLSLTQQRPPTPAPVSLAPLARETIAALPIPESVEAVVEVPDDLAPAHADPGHVQQILHNLCQNALEALEGSGSVRIEAVATEDTVRVRVVDTGRGISPEDLPHVFRPLWSKKPKGAGYGLGLALCRELAERNGGTLVAEGEPGRGSTFTLTLPRVTG